HAYNSRVWAECRQEAVKFLHEAKIRLKGKAESALNNALEHYDTVSKNLTKVAEMYPFDMNILTVKPIGVNKKSKAAAGLLKIAREAESKGLLALEKLVQVL
ncbi:MAG: hypothetical protein ACFE9J_10160, partial [Candidatus Hermodarchaeota archaeon]